jgi:CRP-like cAMP-binding protein
MPRAAGTLLGGLPTAAAITLAALGERREFTAGERLMGQGDTGYHVFLVLRGMVKVVSDAADGRVLLAIRVPGQLVGELAVLDQVPRIATVEAAGPVTTRQIARRGFLDFLAANPEINAAVERSVREKLRMATRFRIDVTTGQAVPRVARVLEYLAALHGRPMAGGTAIDVRLTHQDLLELTGTSPATLNRALRSLRLSGAIYTTRGQVLITDHEALAGAGQGSEDD